MVLRHKGWKWLWYLSKVKKKTKKKPSCTIQQNVYNSIIADHSKMNNNCINYDNIKTVGLVTNIVEWHMSSKEVSL